MIVQRALARARQAQQRRHIRRTCTHPIEFQGEPILDEKAIRRMEKYPYLWWRHPLLWCYRCDQQIQ